MQRNYRKDCAQIRCNLLVFICFLLILFHIEPPSDHHDQLFPSSTLVQRARDDLPEAGAEPRGYLTQSTLLKRAPQLSRQNAYTHLYLSTT